MALKQMQKLKVEVQHLQLVEVMGEEVVMVVEVMVEMVVEMEVEMEVVMEEMMEGTEEEKVIWPSKTH